MCGGGLSCMTCFTQRPFDFLLALTIKRERFVSESNLEHQWIDLSQVRPIKLNERSFPVFKQHDARGKASGWVTAYGEVFVSDVP